MSRTIVAALREDMRTLKEQVYDELLAAIIEQRVAPGERLTLEEIAGQLRVSRTPVRDALARLCAEGFVEPCGRRGFSVVQPSEEHLVELFDIRLMCELHAIRRGLGAVTPELLDRMEALAGECTRLARSLDPRDQRDRVFRDQELHQLIVSLSRNSHLRDLFARLGTHICALRAGPSPEPPAAMSRIYEDEHRLIIAALRLRDLAAAIAAVETHVNNSLARALASLALAKANRRQVLNPMHRASPLAT